MIGQTQLSAKTVNRRTFLKLMGLPALPMAGCRYWPHDGLFNECLDSPLPERLRNHDLVQATWDGIDTRQVWDCHCHLGGTGDSGSGVRINPDMRSLWHPLQYAQYKFYLAASCAASTRASTVDEGMVQRLLQLHHDMPAGYRSLLLAFDYLHDEQGNALSAKSPIHIPDEYARQIAEQHTENFGWIASIHPYREDAITALETAVKHNARAVKWLPSVMGIDASNPRCDAFYQALVKHNLPLLTHTGDEHAVHSASGQAYNNPLLFRRALEHGVRIIFAHCATLGESADIDKGKQAAAVANLDLFARLMAEPQWEKQVFGDIAAVTQINRDRWMIEKIFQNEHWHARLLFGTDYPLPGVLPIYSPQNFVDWGMLTRTQAEVLSEIRRYNPILFDVMLKRLLSVNGKRLHKSVFETRRHFV